MKHYIDALNSSSTHGTISLDRVVDAVNALGDEQARRSMIESLREREPKVRWYTTQDGRLSAVA
jgi:hypothetical protein